MRNYTGTAQVEGRVTGWPEARKPLIHELGRRMYVVPVAGVERGLARFSGENTSKLAFDVVVVDPEMGDEDIYRVVEEAITGNWGYELAGEVSLSQERFGQSLLEFNRMERDRLTIASDTDLVELWHLSRSKEFLHEYLIPRPIPKTTALEAACETAFTDTLTSELDRVYSGEGRGGGKVPVSYLVREKNRPLTAPALETLLGALWESKRIRGQHVFEFDIDRWDHGTLPSWVGLRSLPEFLALFNDSLAQALLGNTVVIRYGTFDSASNFDNARYQVLQALLKMLHPHRHEIQVIFVVPDGKKDVEMRLLRAFPCEAVVLSPGAAPDARTNRGEALAYLRARATRDGLEADDALEERLDARLADKSPLDLDAVFDQWRQAKILADNPQYEGSTRSGIPSEDFVFLTAKERLQELIGLGTVKKHIDKTLTRTRFERRAVAEGLPAKPMSMHAAFLGAPGTGKTEVARLYAEILKDEGILSEGRLIEVSGSTQWNIEETFKASTGSVIFIDEAYALSPGQVTKLIAEMENRRGEVVVILAGYKRSIEALIQSNPGFESRLGVTLEFPDYSPEELVEIFQLMVSQKKMTLGDGALETVRDIAHRGGRRHSDGNARFMRNLFEEAVSNQADRLAKQDEERPVTLEDLRVLLQEDIPLMNALKPEGEDTPELTGRERLAAMVGLEEFKKRFEEYLDFQKIQKVKRDRGIKTEFAPMHMALTGNPGTGKTELARIISQILREEGILSQGELFECGREDFVGQYVGQTAPRVKALFEKAKGSTILADEVYSLRDGARGGFGDEAIAAIIKQMEDMRKDMVFIMAGYTEQTNALIESNPGFKRRIQFQLELPDYTAPELVQILHHFADGDGTILAEGVDEISLPFFERVARQRDFGNAGFVRNYFEEAKRRQASRLARNLRADEELPDEELSTLLPEDFNTELPTKKAKVPVGFSA